MLVDGVPDFYRLQKRTLLTDRFKIELESKRFPASFGAFDCIYKDRRELVWKPLIERKQVLSQLVREDFTLQFQDMWKQRAGCFTVLRMKKAGGRSCKAERKHLPHGQADKGLG